MSKDSVVDRIKKLYDFIGNKKYTIYEGSKWLVPNIKKIESHIDQKYTYKEQYFYNKAVTYTLGLIDHNNKNNQNKGHIKYFKLKNKLLKQKIKTQSYYDKRLENKRLWYNNNKKKVSDYNKQYYQKKIKDNQA